MPEPAFVDLELLDLIADLLAEPLQLADFTAAPADVVFAHFQPASQVIGQVRRSAERFQFAETFDPPPQPIADRRGRIGDP